MMRTIENHVERCHCWKCGGHGKVEGEEAVPDPIRGGDLVGVIRECYDCHGGGGGYQPCGDPGGGSYPVGSL